MWDSGLSWTGARLYYRLPQSTQISYAEYATPTSNVIASDRARLRKAGQTRASAMLFPGPGSLAASAQATQLRKAG